MGIMLDLKQLEGKPFAYEGFCEHRKGWLFPRPVNAHAHFRDPDEEPDIFDLVIPETVKVYGWATAMPNLGKNRILTVDQAHRYRDRILERAHLINPNFRVVTPFYIEAGCDLAALRVAFANNELLAGKMYPKNATTGSAWGVDFRQIRELFPLFDLMQEYDRVLLIHAESVHYLNGRLVEDRNRGSMAIRVIDLILTAFPKLRVVFEHISSRHSVSAMKRWQSKGYRIEATIAPQYLVWDSTVLFDGGMNPVKSSIPILKDYRDQMALIKFMVEGGGMLGTDTAPHNVWKKSQPQACPGGVFNEPVGIHVYFHIFRKYGGRDWFEKFVDFACLKALRFYELEPANEQVFMVEQSWTVPSVYHKEGPVSAYTSVIPMLAEDEIPTTLLAA